MAYKRALTATQMDEFEKLMRVLTNKEMARRFGICEATALRYRDILSGKDQLGPRKARQEAIKNGDKVYRGKLHDKCGTHIKYTANGACVQCRSERNRSRYAKDEASKTKQRREEQLAMIAHHKQNPQLSCIEWR